MKSKMWNFLEKECNNGCEKCKITNLCENISLLSGVGILELMEIEPISVNDFFLNIEKIYKEMEE